VEEIHSLDRFQSSIEVHSARNLFLPIHEISSVQDLQIKPYEFGISITIELFKTTDASENNKTKNIRMNFHLVSFFIFSFP
jgi:hypothetical protein